MKSLGLVLIQPDWSLYKNRKFGHRERYQEYVHTEEKSHEDTERRWPNPTLWHLDLGLLAFRTVRNKFLLSKPLRLQCFVMAALANQYLSVRVGNKQQSWWEIWDSKILALHPYLHPCGSSQKFIYSESWGIFLDSKTKGVCTLHCNGIRGQKHPKRQDEWRQS